MIGHVRPLGSPQTLAVCTLSDVKSHLGISGSGEDAALSALIATVSRAFAARYALGRPPWRQQWQESLPGDGGHYLLLARWPIESVSAVTYGIDDPETIDLTGVSIQSTSPSWSSRDRIYRPDGWNRTSERGALESLAAGTRALEYAVTYVAGWLMPDELETWQATTAYGGSGEKLWVRASTESLLRFEATTAGTSDATEPTWPTTVGGTVTDGTVVWTAREASEVPAEVQRAGVLTVGHWYDGGDDVPTGIQSERLRDLQVNYDFVGARQGQDPIPPVARRLLAVYR